MLTASLMLAAGGGVAVAQFDTASVIGFVRDSSGAAIPGSTVTLVSTQTG